MRIKNLWSSLVAMTKKIKPLPWYYKPLLAFRNELYCINKNTQLISEQNEKMISLLGGLLAQQMENKGRLQ